MNFRYQNFSSFAASLGSGHSITGTHTEAIGWHIYLEFRSTLKLAASEDDVDARKFLKVVEVFTAIVEKVAQEAGALFLEHQVERIHLFLAGDRSLANQVVRIAKRISEGVYAVLPALAPDEFKGFAAAADWSQTAFVAANTDGHTGVISLSPAANDPAKRLGEPGVAPAGTLSIKSEFSGFLPGVDYSCTSNWLLIGIKPPPNNLASVSSSEWRGVAERRVSRLSATPHIPLSTGQLNWGSSPVRMQGWFFRADLDGFSARVQEAFNALQKGDHTKLDKLLEFFETVLNYPMAFRSQFQRDTTIHLPWAGDCANLIVLPPSGVSFNVGAERIPPSVAEKWHSALNLSRGTKVWSDFRELTWAVGVAGGDSTVENGGNDGLLLITQIQAANRSFPIVAGWGARRSSDAYQQPWVLGTETVLPTVDYRRLTNSFKQAFEEVRDHPTFMKATFKRLREATQSQTAHSLKPAILTSALPAVPVPRPYGFR